MAHSCLSPPRKLPPLRASLCWSVSSMWCHCSLQPCWSHNHHQSLCKHPCPLPISGDQALFAWTSRISVCTHSGEQLVVWWALLWHLVFRGHKGQSLLGYYTSTAFIWNLVHTKLIGLDLAPPKFNPGKKSYPRRVWAGSIPWAGAFPPHWTSDISSILKWPSVLIREDGRGGHHVHWAFTIN